MISSIYRHLFLELKRSSYWIDTVLMNIVKGMGLALVSLPFLLVSYVLDYVLDATIQKPQRFWSGARGGASRFRYRFLRLPYVGYCWILF